MSSVEIIEAGIAWLCDDARGNMPIGSWILGFGGCARQNGFVPGWSDIDIIIFRIDGYRQAQAYAQLAHSNLVAHFGLSSTIIVVDQLLISGRFHDVSPFNSVLLNAMSGRPETSRFLVGTPRLGAAALAHEIVNAKSYLSHTRSAISRHLIETDYLASKNNLKRAIRWISSILRCYGRTKGKFLGPYDEALSAVGEALSQSTITSLRRVFSMRFRWETVGDEERENAAHEVTEIFLELWPLCEPSQ
jgi:hypothetical protein